MAYDEDLANRVRRILKKIGHISEKRMFGGLCFLLNGNMALGLINNDLMVRVGSESYENMLAKPNVRKMDFTGKPLKGFLYVGAEGTKSDKDLKQWVSRSIDFAMSLPPKK